MRSTKRIIAIAVLFIGFTVAATVFVLTLRPLARWHVVAMRFDGEPPTDQRIEEVFVRQVYVLPRAITVARDKRSGQVCVGLLATNTLFNTDIPFDVQSACRELGATLVCVDCEEVRRVFDAGSD